MVNIGRWKVYIGQPTLYVVKKRPYNRKNTRNVRIFALKKKLNQYY